jgi:hypothetical protein
MRLRGAQPSVTMMQPSVTNDAARWQKRRRRRRCPLAKTALPVGKDDDNKTMLPAGKDERPLHHQPTSHATHQLFPQHSQPELAYTCTTALRSSDGDGDDAARWQGRRCPLAKTTTTRRRCPLAKTNGTLTTNPPRTQHPPALPSTLNEKRPTQLLPCYAQAMETGTTLPVGKYRRRCPLARTTTRQRTTAMTITAIHLTHTAHTHIPTDTYRHSHKRTNRHKDIKTQRPVDLGNAET